MSEEIAFENGRIVNFEGLVTLDRVIMYTAVHHSSTSTYMPNFIEIKKKFLWTHARTYVVVVVVEFIQLCGHKTK